MYFAQKMKTIKIIKTVWIFAKKYKWSFILSYSVLLLELLFSQLLPLKLSNLVNSAVYEPNIISFLKCAISYSIIFIGFATCGYIQLQLWQRIHNKYIYDIRITCYKAILMSKPIVLSNFQTGDAIKTIEADTEEFHHIIQRYAMRVLNACLGTGASLIIVCKLKWEIAFFMVLIIPFSVIVSKKLKYKLSDLSKNLRVKEGAFSAWLMEILKNLQEIKLFSADKKILYLFSKKKHDIIRTSVKQEKTQFLLENLIELIFLISDILFYIFCAFFVISKTINIGEYLALSSYFTKITNNVKQILNSDIQYQKRKTCIEHVLKLLCISSENNIDKLPLVIKKGTIEVNNLNFRYDEEKPILNNLNFKVNSLEKIGIIGQSGVGKSTIANLLLKMYEPQTGTILIDGIDIKNCAVKSIRQGIGLMSQDSIIFNSTIRDNITFGNNTSDEKLYEILEKVELKQKIDELPDKLNTILGENGVELSGGQKQRLCLARLLYKNPRIIIFDESTSALDNQTELFVEKMIEQLIKDKTVIKISHKITSMVNMDRILVLQNGCQVGYDTYKNLLKNNKHFRDLLNQQKDLEYEIL